MTSNYKGPATAPSLQWEVLVALRLYDIILFILAPILWTGFNVGYLPPTQMVILGGIAFLLYGFVLREPRTKSARFVRASLIMLGVATAFILLNFFAGLCLSILTGSADAIIVNAITCMGSIVFFVITMRYRPFQVLNARVTTWVQAWQARGRRSRVFRHHYFGIAGIAWICLSLGILWVPYTTYVQDPPDGLDVSAQQIGFWTSTSPLDPDNEGSSSYLTNETLEFFAASGVYFVLGCYFYDPYEDLLQVLNRCRTFGNEVNIYFCPKGECQWYTNIWTFEQMCIDIVEVLSALNESNFLGHPVTTLLYDMEGLAYEFHFPLYANNTNITSQLAAFYEIQSQFVAFNQHVREDYHLNIKICTDWSQRADAFDGDDDLSFLNGQMTDENASWSYMVYRQNFLDYNFLLDHCKVLADGDTIILNSWLSNDSFCYRDIECLIDECRFVWGYSGKKLNLEFWTMSNFLPSYHVSGMIQLVQALRAPPSTWEPVVVQNSWPYSFYWDLTVYGTTLLDLYGPLFRLMLH